MPDLGKYAVSVLTAYGVSGVILIALLIQSWLRYRVLRKNLTQIEDRSKVVD